MNKIFQIAFYDFRRLMFNPITLIAMAVVLVCCMIVSSVYKIPTTQAYAATISGATTQEVFNNFNSTAPGTQDTATSLTALIEQANKIIEVQKRDSCPENDDFFKAVDPFDKIKYELQKYHTNKNSSTYYLNGISEVKTASANLKAYIEKYEKLKMFETRLLFKKSTFQTLKSISQYFETTVQSTGTIAEVLDDLYANIGKIDTLQKLKGDIWTVSTENLTEYAQKYVVKATTKTGLINDEIRKVYAYSSPTDATNIDKLSSLITNYKLTCESALESVQDELLLLLRSQYHDLDKLYGYQKIQQEDVKTSLSKATYFLEDKELYYTSYQIPLNFNIGSSKVTAFDNTFFIIRIIGFATVLFGIFCAYKLFGRDRKNGKMDIILSQDVTFRQVFAGKFFAILFCTLYVLLAYTLLMFVWAIIFHPIMAGEIFAIFNMSSPYTVHPFVFLLLKLAGIELQVIFYAIITIFLMNISRKFEIFFAVAVVLFVVATICNTYLNGLLVYCLFPFIHSDLTAFLGGGQMNAGFLQTALYSYGNFFISLVYYTVVVVLLYNFTNQLFKKN